VWALAMERVEIEALKSMKDSVYQNINSSAYEET
jgi:hypothetical protein